MATFRARKIKMVVNKKILISSDKAASKFTVYVLSAYIISLKYNALRLSLEESIQNITLSTTRSLYSPQQFHIMNVMMTCLFD
ncbi:Uncharacterised protein [Citrobacter koseri]|uniref:Uncharacterized protein n=2 Tax=Citrobacter koseri TaxID=545 RepID=A0A3S4M6E8_CITKO|nr:Uncharacterised protein [Citrobacter koseri]